MPRIPSCTARRSSRPDCAEREPGHASSFPSVGVGRNTTSASERSQSGCTRAVEIAYSGAPGGTRPPRRRTAGGGEQQQKSGTRSARPGPAAPERRADQRRAPAMPMVQRPGAATAPARSTPARARQHNRRAQQAVAAKMPRIPPRDQTARDRRTGQRCSRFFPAIARNADIQRRLTRAHERGPPTPPAAAASCRESSPQKRSAGKASQITPPGPRVPGRSKRLRTSGRKTV